MAAAAARHGRCDDDADDGRCHRMSKRFHTLEPPAVLSRAPIRAQGTQRQRSQRQAKKVQPKQTKETDRFGALEVGGLAGVATPTTCSEPLARRPAEELDDDDEGVADAARWDFTHWLLIVTVVAGDAAVGEKKNRRRERKKKHANGRKKRIAFFFSLATVEIVNRLSSSFRFFSPFFLTKVKRGANSKKK